MNWKVSVMLALITHAFGFKSDVIHYDDIKMMLSSCPEARVLLKENSTVIKLDAMTVAIKKLLTSPAARDIVLDFFSWLYLRYTVRPSEKIISPSSHLAHFCHQSDAMCDEEILEILEIINAGGMPPAFLDFLCLYGSVHSHLRGPWSEAVISTLDTCKTKFGFCCLPHLCTAEQYCKLMDDRTAWMMYESALLRYLMHVPVSEQFLERMTDPLFAIVPCNETLRSALPKIIRGPNRRLLYTCWRDRFHAGFQAGENIYPFAALFLAIWEGEGKEPVDEAAKLLASDSHEEIALGMTCLSMTCTSEPLIDYLDDVSAALVAILKDSSNPAFHPAANLACTLLEQGLLAPKVLDSDAIFLALIDNMDISAGRQAEVLLSLLPLRDRSPLLETPILHGLRKHYKKIFTHSMTKEEFYCSYGEIGFAMLSHTGYFRSNGERRTAFEKLLNHIQVYRDKCNTADLSRIQLLVDQVYGVIFDKVACHVSIAPEVVNRLRDIAASGKIIPYNTEHAVIEAASCLRFRPSAFSDCEVEALLRMPIELKCPLDPQTVTEWFFLLCWYGMSQNAIDFFLAHKEVLLRPVYLPMSIFDAPEDEDMEPHIERANTSLGRGSNYLSRLALGIHIMEMLGHGEAAEVLPAIKPFYKEVDNCYLSAEENFLIRSMKHNKHFIGLGAASFTYDSAYQMFLDLPPI